MAPEITMPARRSLRAYAYDPLRADLEGTTTTVSVPYEPVGLGPAGSLIKVVDYDPVREVWYAPVDLDDPLVLAQDGLMPSEADPRSHQQMVYAVATSLLEHFEAALGRRFRFTRGPMEILPHAFYEDNAYYDPESRRVLFGYFRADRKHPGAMLPGQMVFTCLSHDVVAHELTHAIVDRLRPHLNDETNLDVAAFHEAFADLMALFHHFTLPDLVRRELARTRGDLSTAAPLVEFARQFGEASAIGSALRSGIDRPDPDALARTSECHDRGAILVGAVFGAFITTYEIRIADLIRIATSGTGELPRGHLHPDLVARIADEAVANAKRFMTICVRAFDYMPVLDLTFGDFLRAMVTADRTLFPDDKARVRAVLVESFRQRGIYPENVASLAEGNLTWPQVDHRERLPQVDAMIRWTAEDSDLSTRANRLTSRQNDRLLAIRRAELPRVARSIQRLISGAPVKFGFHPNTRRFPISIQRFHASFRPNQDGQSRADIVVDALQKRPDLMARAELDGTGIEVWAGTTIVADALGRIRHVITKPLARDANHPFRGVGGDRFANICELVETADAMDLTRAWTNAPDRITRAYSFAVLHRGRRGGAR